MGEVHTTRSALAGLARAQAAEGRAENAAKLLSFVESLSNDLDIPVSERSQDKRESERAELFSRLGDRFKSAWERGRAMSLEEAISLALTTSGPIGTTGR